MPPPEYRRFHWTRQAIALCVMVSAAVFVAWIMFGSWVPKSGLELGVAISFSIGHPLGAYWMLYDSWRSRTLSVRRVFWGMVPYSFVWYYLNSRQGTNTAKAAMKWCCMGFKGNFEMAGSRGFGMFVSTKDGPEPIFILQHRALDEHSPLPNTTYPITVVTDARIQFCPWCGVRLKQFYGDSYGKLDRSDLRVSIKCS